MCHPPTPMRCSGAVVSDANHERQRTRHPRPARHRTTKARAAPRDLLHQPARRVPGCTVPTPVSWDNFFPGRGAAVSNLSRSPGRHVPGRAFLGRRELPGDRQEARLTMLETRRTCQSCSAPLPPDARSDSRTCSSRCRQALHRKEKAARTRAETALQAARAPAPVTKRDEPVTPRPAEEITEQVRSQWEDRYWNRGSQW